MKSVRPWTGCWIVLAASWVAPIALAPLAAQEPTVEERVERLEEEVERLRQQLEGRDTADIAEIRRQLDAIVAELERLRLGQRARPEADSMAFGFAPAASRVYRIQQGVSIGGYGEFLYEKFAGSRQDGEASEETDRIDALRAVLYFGYKFDDKILFNSEIEIEHGTSQSGSVSVEFAYLDYRFWNMAGGRGGLLLVPMGIINELHEPTFLGTERPETERQIIPSTWREVGLGLFGETGPVEWRAYLINGFDAIGGNSSNAGGFSASGLRGGRQKGSRAIAEDFAAVARVDLNPVLGLRAGTSLYLGNSGQGAESALDQGMTIRAFTSIWETHLMYRAMGLDLRGLISSAWVGDVEELNAAKGLEGDDSIGERLIGGYVQVGYDLLHRAATSHEIVPYARLERLNTQDRVPDGFEANPENARSILSLGAAWRPIPNFIFKTDYQIHWNDASTGVNQFNVALGYVF